MNTHLKNPQSLQSYEAPRVNASPPHTSMSHRSDSISQSKPLASEKKKVSYTLQSFLDAQENPAKEVILSSTLPMELGIRDMLTRQGIMFDIKDSSAHIILFNSIVIHIYKAQQIRTNPESIISDLVITLNKAYQILFIIVSFAEFKETFEGQTRLLKRKLHEWKDVSSEKVTLITVDTLEELNYFINNIYTYNKKKRN